jgi:NAD(P)H-quinone oxidoreductase subunit 5
MKKRTGRSPMNLLDSSPVSLAAAQLAVPIFGLALLVPLWSHGRAAAGHAARLMAAALVFAVTAATVVAVQGSVDWRSAGGLVSFRFDALSATLLVLVSFLGLVVTRYSVNYLNGDPRQARFTRALLATLASVLLLAIAGNLLQFVVCWTATSLGLHRLLTFPSGSRSAALAARKKFLISRLGDACLIGALALVWKGFGTWDFAALFAAAENPGPAQAAVLPWVAWLVVAAALMKSAQLPFHSWLPETLDTPTPVSALMHAGLINAGGFLIVRLSPLLVQAPGALDALAAVGGATALFGSLVMMTQPSIKRSLAWSTISQMGFMMLQCGLGAFALAMLHLVAHSLYKAHAFLASGGVVAKTRPEFATSPAARPLALIGALGAAAVLAAAGGAVFGFGASGPGPLLLGSVFLMALAQLVAALAAGPWRPRLAFWGLLAAAGTAAAGLGLHKLFGHWLADCLPAYTPQHGPAAHLLMAGAGLLFLALILVQAQAARGTAPAWLARLYVHASNGFYLGTLLERLTRRLLPL